MVISFAMNRSTILEGTELEKALEYLVPDISFADLSSEFVVVATDLESGEAVRLREGPLRPALVATSAIPGMVPAVQIGERWLVDGGVLAEVPTMVAKEVGWPVVAVDARGTTAEG